MQGRATVRCSGVVPGDRCCRMPLRRSPGSQGTADGAGEICRLDSHGEGHTFPRVTTPPHFFILTPEDCADILKRNHTGRIAFLNGAVVDIEPVGYVARERWIFVRSASGTKLEAFAHHPYVAFEVDEVEGPFEWRSVVAHGTVYVLTPEGAPLDREDYERALTSLRTIMPAALTKDDPVPERTNLYGIHIDRMEGRMAAAAPRPGGRKRKVARAKKGPPPRAADGF